MRLRRQPDLLIGYVQVGGGVIQGVEGTGFSVSRTGPGNYVVKLPPGYRLVSVLADGAVSIPGVAFVGTNPGAITMWTTNTGAGVDVNFAFTAARF